MFGRTRTSTILDAKRPRWDGDGGSVGPAWWWYCGSVPQLAVSAGPFWCDLVPYDQPALNDQSRKNQPIAFFKIQINKFSIPS